MDVKTIYFVILGLFAMFGSSGAVADKSFFDFEIRTLDGEPLSLSRFSGQVVLAVNTASKCGFTSQYEGLEALYNRYRARGFTVIGFPSNDFMGQEPGSNAEIKSFCQKNYGVTFPIAEKGPVKGEAKQPVFEFLTKDSGEGDPGWNFVKFLIDQHGRVVGRFSSMTKPESPKITQQIESLLENPKNK